jgi:EpsI family protein
MSDDFPMDHRARVSRREVVAGLAMLAAGGVAAARKPNIPIDYMGNHKLDEIVPTKVGRWKFISSSGLVTPPPDQLAQAVYSQLLTRVYTDGEAPIFLLLAYSANQTGFLQVHRPEFCYTAAGYRLSDFEQHRIQVDPSLAIPTNSLTATREDTTEKLIYWTRIGKETPLSWAQQKIAVAKQNLERLIPDAALVRISTVGVDEAQALRTLDEFTQTLIRSVPQQFRRVFIA